MKTKKRSILQKLKPTLLFILCLLCIANSVACIDENDDLGTIDNSTSAYEKYRTYQSAYTIDEHIERIDNLLERNLKYHINDYTPRDIVAYNFITNIEILYSIGYEFPEYFLVEFKVPEGTLNVFGEPYSYSECFLIGTIKNDEYYQLDFEWELSVYGPYVKGPPFVKGESPYKNMQEKSQKKYYAYDYSFPGENCAYKENDKYVFINNDELNTNYPTEERINILGNVVYTTVWKRGGADPLLEPEVTVESLGERHFYSNYTAQENLQRLETLVKTNPELIAVEELYEASNIIDVQIMYSLYYEYPEYFLIQFKKESLDEDGAYNYQFIVGQIRNDEFYKIYVSPFDNNLGISPYLNNTKTYGTKKYYVPIDENKQIGAFYFVTKDKGFLTSITWNKAYHMFYRIDKNMDYIKYLDGQTLMPLMIT